MFWAEILKYRFINRGPSLKNKESVFVWSLSRTPPSVRSDFKSTFLLVRFTATRFSLLASLTLSAPGAPLNSQKDTADCTQSAGSCTEPLPRVRQTTRCRLTQGLFARMSARRNGGNFKGKDVLEVSSPKIEQLTHGVADVSLGSAQDDGEWEVIARKSKNRAGSSAAKQWGPQNSNSKAWAQVDAQKPVMRNSGGSGRGAGNFWPSQTSDMRKPVGRGNVRQQSSARVSENSYVAPQHVIPPPLDHGWNWQSRAGVTQPKGSEDVHGKDDKDSNAAAASAAVDDDDDNSDAVGDTDDELFSDEFDSDSSEKSHETRKNSRWFKKFFEILDSLTVDEINDPVRQWHCPACQGGPGSIDWYRGLQPLMTHAKTKGSKRVMLHRELAELLDEELRRKGTTVIPAGEAFGKWKGLKDEEKDHEIVWPPMIVIMNTKLEQDDNDKWIGMGNQELLEYFSPYSAARARHSYGPQGHRGMSILIFEASARGYLEAERLHKHFTEQGTDRDAWDRRRVLFQSGGKRQLYGYMAVKEDLDIFNQHSQGKSRLKFEMRSYQEMVVNQIRQMSEDNQQLMWFKNRVAKEQRHAKALEESLGIVSEKLRKTTEENRIVRQRTKLQHKENQEEMYLQEQFFKDQIKIIHESRDAKEENFERLQQEERDKVKHSYLNPSNAEEQKYRSEEIENFIKSQQKEMEEFVAERDMLMKAHDDDKAAMKRRHWEEEVELEKDFDAKLTQLMEKYSPHLPEEISN